MVNYDDLNNAYKQRLEENIIERISYKKEIDLRSAMDIYYKSKLSAQINSGAFGLENMDFKYLADDLFENEPELFTKASH